MKLPDGTVIMHAGRPYDPVKAHEYYMRTRKLKGRKKAAAIAKAPPQADQKRYRAALDRFLGNLPMAQEGASIAKTEAFVMRMRTMSDDEMKAEAARIKKERGNMDGAQVATIEALLKNRARVRKKRDAAKKGGAGGSGATAKRTAQKNNTSKAALAVLTRPGG